MAEPEGAGLDDEAVAGVTDARLRRLLSDHWTTTMERQPTWATRLGRHAYDDRLGDNSPEGYARDRDLRRLWLDEARSLPLDSLAEPDRTTAALFTDELAADEASEVCASEQWNVSPRENALVFANYLADLQPNDTPEEGARLLARYRALPAWFDHEIANLRLGLASGRTPPDGTTRLLVDMLDRQIALPSGEWELMKPSSKQYEDAAATASFQAEVRAVVDGPIRAAVTRYRDFVRDELLPKARPEEQAGVKFLPAGEACYAAMIRRHTSLDRSADDLHALGLAELDRIHAEMRVLFERQFGSADLEAGFARLRTDTSLYFTTSDEVEAKARSAVAAAAARIPEFFGRLPVARCDVRPVPDYEAPYTTIAYYREPSPGGERPGEYFVNVFAPTTRPRYEAEVLAWHEAIPGHHLQIAIAQELPETPAFRKHSGWTAFVEGWALYTERLADEMGLYSSDLDRIGMLSFDSWRAARLVVDTGIHARGWTRGQAEAFMQDNTPLAVNNIANEVDRYINTPGQALAYKVGQTEIRRMRNEAEAALGPRFDRKAFHDVVLGGGAVSLPVLERRVREWASTGSVAAPPSTRSP